MDNREQMVGEIFFKKLWELESGRTVGTLACRLECGDKVRVQYRDGAFYVALIDQIDSSENICFSGPRVAVANLLGRLGAVPDSATFE